MLSKRIDFDVDRKGKRRKREKSPLGMGELK